MTIKENISLADYTSFKIGGPARYFLIVENVDDLIEAMDFANDKRLPYFVLGEGSNLLVSDEGYKGVLIKIQNDTLVSSRVPTQGVGTRDLTPHNNHLDEIPRPRHFLPDGRQDVSGLGMTEYVITVGAGILLNDLVNFATENNLTGMEWATGIPGTVGGAIRGNAGAFGACIADNINSVCCLSPYLSLRGGVPPLAERRRSNPVIKEYNNSDCKFSYRDSIFKHNQDIIISAEIKLQKGDKQESQRLINQYLKTRKQKHPLEYPSAGCVFQNPKPLAAADLIEQCGLKEKQIGQAMISKKHANFIVNLNKAKSQDVLKLTELIKREVKSNFKIDLKEEIEYLGFSKF